LAVPAVADGHGGRWQAAALRAAADEAWPQGPCACLPRGGICDNGAPRSRRPVAAGSPPGHPAHRAAGQWRSRSDAASPPGPVPARGGAGPDRGPKAPQIAGTRPEGEGRAPREETFTG
jgi:hypothetical protein